MSDPTAVVAAAPLVAAFVPIVVQVAGAVIAGAIAWAAARFSKATGVQLRASALTRITAAAQSEAGALIAEAGDNLAMKSIPVGSSTVAAIANKLATNLPAEMKTAGLTPAHVATIVAGEIGKMQASMTSVPAPAAALAK
jgi:hypothetical protein